MTLLDVINTSIRYLACNVDLWEDSNFPHVYNQIQNLYKFWVCCAAQVQMSARWKFVHRDDGHQTGWHNEMHNSTSTPKWAFSLDTSLHEWLSMCSWFNMIVFSRLVATLFKMAVDQHVRLLARRLWRFAVGALQIRHGLLEQLVLSQ